MSASIGLDFGTTNTVLAVRNGEATRSLEFLSPAGAADSMRTCLSFMRDRGSVEIEAGATAIRQFIDNPGDCRFLQSIKSFAASSLFQGTLIFAKRFQFEDLMEAYLQRLKDYADADAFAGLDRIVVGRPVQFAGTNPDESLALDRYNSALARLGFPEVHFIYEPVAAAFFFARQLKQDATVLVADFGGGTTDYSIIRFETHAGVLQAKPIGHSGVGIAGDQFDFRIIDNVVSPQIGKGSQFKSFDKFLDVPSNYYANFGRWNQLSIFKTLKDFKELKSLVRTATEPERLERFIELVEHDEGYPLYQAVSATKMRLSEAEETEFEFAPLGPGSKRLVRRADFEGWIADDLRAMEAALDAVLQRAEIGVDGIDKVFLTGGTSFVPAVRRMFAERFGAGRIEGGGELLSIAHGLALIGDEPDLGRWTAGSPLAGNA